MIPQAVLAAMAHKDKAPLVLVVLTLVPLAVSEALTQAPTLAVLAEPLALVMAQQEHQPMPDHTAPTSQTRRTLESTQILMVGALMAPQEASAALTALTALMVLMVQQVESVALTARQEAHMEMTHAQPMQDLTAPMSPTS
jgi:hypothetical protein